jgi:hypothetical protein
MLPNQHTEMTAAIEACSDLLENEKNILIWCLPNATTGEMQTAAQRLKNRGAAYYDSAAKLYECSVDPKKATPLGVIRGAHELMNLGPAYNDRAAKVFEGIANHPDADPLNIKWSADGLILLANLHPQGSHQYIRYHKKGDTLKATTGGIIGEAYELLNLGNRNPKDSPKRIECHDKAAAFFVKAANHADALQMDISLVESELKELKDSYPESSDIRKAYHDIGDKLLKLRDKQ